MKRKNQRISDLFYNNRFLLVFSVIAAVAIWLVVAVEFSPETETVIKDVSIEFDNKQPEKFGLRPFGEYDKDVNVTVKGRRIVVDADDMKNQLVAKAQTSYVTGVGTYSLKIDVSPKNDSAEFEIIGTDLDEVVVYFDYYTEKEFVVDSQIDLGESVDSEEYYIPDEEGFIFPESNTIKITGPAAEINKISKVVAKGSVDGKLNSTTTVDAAVEIITVDGSKLQYISNPTTVMPVTIPVYRVADLKMRCSFVNTPSNYIDNLPFTVNVGPSKAKFGVPESRLDGSDTLDITSIDFSRLHSGVNTFYINTEDISGCVNLDKTERFTVVVDTGNLETAVIQAPAGITFSGKPDRKNVETVSIDFSEVTMVGPAESIAQIAPDTVTLTADLSSIADNFTGQTQVPVRVTTNDCWSYGEYYITVNIS